MLYGAARRPPHLPGQQREPMNASQNLSLGETREIFWNTPEFFHTTLIEIRDFAHFSLPLVSRLNGSRNKSAGHP